PTHEAVRLHVANLSRTQVDCISWTFPALAGTTGEISMRSLGLLHAVSSGLCGFRQTLRWAAMATAAACVLAVPLAHAADVATDAASEGAVRVKLTQARVEIEAGKE